MKTLRVNKQAFICSLIILSFCCSPIFFVSGETYTIIDERFTIAPQRPKVFSEANFNLTNLNEFIIGIPESSAISGRADSNTYYFEIHSTGRVEIYFLDSPDYLNFASDWDGAFPAPPSVYAYRLICDSYIQQEFTLPAGA